MKATTIKLDGELLEELNKTKPASETLTSYVRKTLEKDLNRMKLREAGAEYSAFLKANPEEESWMNEWEEAQLTSTPVQKDGE